MIAAPQALAIPIDERRDRPNPARHLNARRDCVRGQDRIGDACGEIRIQWARFCQVIKRPIFVEAGHFHAKFDRPAISSNSQRAVAILRDRHHAPVDLRRQGPVDPDFFLAGRLSLLQRRIVEEGSVRHA